MISFKGRQCPKYMILQTVHCYLVYSLNTYYPDEIMTEREIPVDHSIIICWVI